MDQEYISNITEWQSFQLNTFDGSRSVCTVPGDMSIAYTPNSEAASRIVTRLAASMSFTVFCLGGSNFTYANLTSSFNQGSMNDVLNNPVAFFEFLQDNNVTYDQKRFQGQAFDSVGELEDYVINDPAAKQVFMGLVFDDSWRNTTALPDTLTYALRPPAAPRVEQESSGLSAASGWLTNLLFPTRPSSNGPRSGSGKAGGKPHYLTEGFLTAQHFLDTEFLRMKAEEEGIPFPATAAIDMTFERFPYPPYPKDPYISGIGSNLPFIILLCFIYLGQQTAKSVAIEKDSGLKEYMLMMGLSRTALWTSYFVHYFCMFFVSVSIVTIVLCCPFSANGAIINYTHWSVIYVFLILYGVSLINMGFMISTWFQSANSVAATTGVLIFIFYLPYGFIQQDIDGTPDGVKIIMSLLSPVAMSFGFSQVAAWETRGLGIQWSTLATDVSSSNRQTMLGTFILGAIIITIIIIKLIIIIITTYHP